MTYRQDYGMMDVYGGGFIMSGDGKKSLYGFEMNGVDARRKPWPEKKNYNIKMLWQKSHEILGLALSGMSQNDISNELGITKDCVSKTVNSELGQKKLAAMREERDGDFINVSKRIAELAEKAVETYEEIFDSDTISYNLKKATADTVLMDIGGHRAATKIDSRNVSLTASVEELEEFKRLGHKAAKEAGFLIELPEGDYHELKETTE